MKQIIDYFDRAYIINLSDRKDRRQQTEREFGRMGMMIPNEKVQFYTAVRPSDKGRFQDIGTRGCFNSHRGVLELARKHQLRNVLIFEDDVSFRNVDAALQKQMISKLSCEDWDAVFFGYSKPSDKYLRGPLVQWPNDILGAHFYGVNGSFVPAMLQYMNECELRPRDHPEGGPMPADGMYNHVRYVNPNINLFVSVPNLAHQRSSRTDISQIHILDRMPLLNPVMRSVRAIKHRLRMAVDRKNLRRQLDRD
jgi:glycosyl transferase, family 25